MKFLKHVGKHGDRKVAIVFRQIPGEEHMALVVYTSLLNQNIHDPLISCIESDAAQSSDSLADALNRAYTKTGQIILQVLHREGMLKKVQTNQIVVTPVPNQSVKLDELNSLLTEMEKGEEAIKKLAEIDASRGLQDPKDVARRMRESRDQRAATTSVQPLQTSSSSALGDDAISNNLRAQAARMEAEANGLLSEAKRLRDEAEQLNPTTSSVSAVVSAESSTEPVKKTRRTKKTAVAQ